MSSRVSFLILAHLGLAACNKEPLPAAPDAAATPVATPTPTATVPAVKTCSKEADCAGGEFCDIRGDASTGVCETRPTRGRPLVVDGVAHLAPYVHETPSLTSEEIDALRDAARDEHASIAAFARTIAELMALGAPTWLLHETHVALGDEIRHTELSLAMLERLTGTRRSIAPLDAATLPLHRSRDDFFRDVFRGGAVGESMAAAEAESRRAQTTDPELRAFYEVIVTDESRHAALAFKTLRWLVETHPELSTVLANERARLSLEARALVGPLFDFV